MLELALVDRSAQELVHLVSLEFLDVSDNNLTVLPATALSTLPKLSKLWVARNGIETISAKLQAMQSLVELKITGNPVCEDQAEMDEARKNISKLIEDE